MFKPGEQSACQKDWLVEGRHEHGWQCTTTEQRRHVVPTQPTASCLAPDCHVPTVSSDC